MKLVNRGIVDFLICIAFLLIADTACGQGASGFEAPAVLLPSPNAAELGKYGDIPVNMSTGSLNLNIPLFTYSTKNLKVPISFSYTTGGFRVNEISSRAGFDWVLNCGGVITRTIVDEPDLDYPTTRLVAPDLSVLNESTWNYLYNSTLAGYDTQPDIFYFNFGGYSGKFVVNDSGRIVTVPHNNLKIEYFFLPDSTGFRITTPDGIKYFFGSDSATEYTRIVENSTCGGSIYSDYVPTAWYLTKMVHPDGDSIVFDYGTGNANYYSNVSQTIYTKNFTSMDCNDASVSCPIMEDKLCYTRSQMLFSRLSKISSTAFGTIEFAYQNRNDMSGDGLISSITLYDDSHVQLKKFSASYQEIVSPSSGYGGGQIYTEMRYRYFLTKISEYGKTTSNPKEHIFSYNNLSNLPARLTFCQDYQGYYNGKYGNIDLVPKPTDAGLQTAFNNHGGNRDPDSNYVSVGLLTQIKYPTGGASLITYENHQKPSIKINQTYPSWTPTVGGRGTDAAYLNGESVIYTDTFTAKYSAVGQISTSYFSDDGSTDPDTHIKMKAEILNDITGVVKYSKNVAQNQNVTDTLSVVTGTRYRLRITIWGDHIYYGALSLKYNGPATNDTVNINQIYPGARVKQVLTSDSLNSQSLKLVRYYYQNLNNFSPSNVQIPANPVFIYPYNTTVQCISNGGSGNYLSNQIGCTYNVLYSTAQNGESLVSSSTLYTSVLESAGSYFENGGKEYKYDVYGSNGSFPVMGQDQLAAPHSNLGYDNCELLEENTFKWVNNSPVYLKKVINSYRPDSRTSQNIKGYFISMSFQPFIAYLPHRVSDFAAFNVNYYILGAPWRYIDTTTTINYDQNGLNPVIQKVAYQYDQPVHGLVSKIYVLNSKGSPVIDSLFYPQDLTLAGGEEIARQKLVANYQIAAMIEKRAYSNLSKDIKHTVFKQLSNSNPVQDKLLTNTGKLGGFETVLTFTDFDSKSNLLGFIGRDGLVKSYLYGYKSQLPVAEVVGAPYSQVKNYITQSILDNPTSDWQIRSHLAGLRTSFPGALIRTFTYKPLVGITSETDQSGKTIFYEYDDFSRLSIVRDQDSNIIKKICYNLAGQTESCGILYYSSAKTGSFSKNCGAGYSTTPIPFSLPDSAYSSFIDKPTADSIANVNFNIRGQAHADSVGVCTAVCLNCTGVNKKCIEGICTTGFKVYTASIYQGPKSYLCYYHYEFSDGSTSATYSESNFNPCPILN